MKKYNVYGLGNALVDMEFQVEDNFLNEMRVEKGIMTLVDEEIQHQMMCKLDAFEGNKSSGGSAANTLIAVTAMGGSAYYSCKLPTMNLVIFTCTTCQRWVSTQI